MMGQLYDVNVRTINEHLKKVFADRELQEDSVIRRFRITPHVESEFEKYRIMQDRLYQSDFDRLLGGTGEAVDVTPFVEVEKRLTNEKGAIAAAGALPQALSQLQHQLAGEAGTGCPAP